MAPGISYSAARARSTPFSPDDGFEEPRFQTQEEKLRFSISRGDVGVDIQQRTWLASLTVACAPCDEGMYQALDFDARLGTAFVHII